MTTLPRLTLIAAVALCAGTAQAQTQEAAPAATHQVLSTNPFGDLLTWWNVEYERTVGPATTWVASASAIPSEYASASVMVRWYPAQTPLDGFYLGAHAGIFSFHDYAHGADTVPGAGLDVGRAWLLGRQQRTSISLGFGMTRLAAGSRSAAPSVWPVPRLINVGVAF